MSLTVEELIAQAGYASLAELKAALSKNSNVQALVTQILDEIEESSLTTTSLHDTIPQLASDIYDEANHKKSQKRLLQMLRDMGIDLTQARDAGFPIPDKETGR